MTTYHLEAPRQGTVSRSTTRSTLGAYCITARARHAKRRNPALGWLLVALGLIGANMLDPHGTARAEGGTQSFAIPAQPLDRALTRFADEAGIELMLPTDLVRGRQSQGLTGRFTAEQALDSSSMGRISPTALPPHGP